MCLVAYYPLNFFLIYFLTFKIGYHTNDYSDYGLSWQENELAIQGLGQIGLWLSISIAVWFLILGELLIIKHSNWQL